MSGVSLKDLLSRMSDDAETLRLHVLLPNIDLSPIYLAYDAVTRNLSREAIQRALARVDSDVEAVSAHVRKINDIEHTLRRRRAKLHNFLQPVAALPVEVLQRILLHAVEPHKRYIYHKFHQSPIIFSQVCSTWRHVAQSYPPIWTVIRSRPGEHDHYKLYALYSRGRPLEFHQYKSYQMVSGVGPENDEVQSRITTLHLEFDSVDIDWLDYPQFWSRVDCASIQDLSLFHLRDSIKTHSHVLEDFTSIRHLSLSRLFIPLSTSQLVEIVSLNLDSIDLHDREFIELMNSCNNLEELALSDVGIEGWNFSTRQTMSSLRTLSLDREDFEILSLLFASYEAPNLKTIKFDALGLGWTWLDHGAETDWDVTDVTDDDYHNDCLASCLRLFRFFLKNATSVQALTLGGNADEMRYILKALWPHSSYSEHQYLPYLSDLTLLMPRPTPAERLQTADCRRLLKSYVQERQSASRSLQRLTAPRFLLKNDIGWMRDQVGELELADRLTICDFPGHVVL